VVPELASRAHVAKVIPIIEEALARAKLGLEDVDAVAVTRGPGLVGALLVALQAGKALAWARGLPLVGVNHLEGHLAAIFLDNEAPPPWPHLGLLVSGGHTELVEVAGHGQHRILGATRDDAAGEAFDKVGKLLGLGYPAGAKIDRLAQSGDARAVPFPRSMRRHALDFSFSGLKTSALHALEQRGLPEGQALADFCASFQAAVVRQLVDKTALALEQTGHRHLVLAGGVAANRGLRRGLEELCAARAVQLHVPPPRLCTDNGAMIAAAGFFRLQAGERASLSLNATASLPLGGVAPPTGKVR
jgi:N6-L-threonylcarbamoyladenine synthase